MQLPNRQQIKEKLTLKTGINLALLMGMMFTAAFSVETRYANSEDVAKKFGIVEQSLNKIYRQQLRQERREILKVPERERRSSETNRLDEVESELRSLGEIIVRPTSETNFPTVAEGSELERETNQ